MAQLLIDSVLVAEEVPEPSDDLEADTRSAHQEGLQGDVDHHILGVREHLCDC